MSERLAEIKNMIANVKVSEHHYEAQRLDRVKAVQAIMWLIAKVERLKAALEHQTWCPDCGKVLEIPNPLAVEVERLKADLKDANTGKMWRSDEIKRLKELNVNLGESNRLRAAEIQELLDLVNSSKLG